MLLTVLIVLAVYLLSCYAYGAVLLMRKNFGRRSSDDLRGVVTHRYPSAADHAAPHVASHATPRKAAA